MNNANLKFNVLDLEQGTKEWLDARAKHITATEIAHLKCGHTSLYKLIALKRGLAKAPCLDDNPAVNEGKLFEPIIRNCVPKFWPYTIGENETELSAPCCESLEDPFFMASLDGYSYSKGVVVEIKNIFSRSHERYQDVVKNGLQSKACTEYGYYYQVQWQLYVTNSQVGILVFHHPKNGMFDGTSLRPFVIKRDEKVINELKELALKVKDILQNNLPVDPEPNEELYLSNEQARNVEGRINEIKFIEELITNASTSLNALKAKKQVIIDSLKDELLNGDVNKIYGYDFSLSVSERKGAVDYDKLFLDLNIDKNVVEKYRKGKTLITKLTLTK